MQLLPARERKRKKERERQRSREREREKIEDADLIELLTNESPAEKVKRLRLG